MTKQCPLLIVHGVCIRLLALALTQVQLPMVGRAVTAALLVLLTGCASLPAGVQRPVSVARVEVSETRLARVAAVSRPEADSLSSGVRLLAAGEQAFEARIALARAAEKSIDAQYYVIASDLSGLQFLRELSDAATRGVRVRLLVDDLHTTGQDTLFAGLAAQSNVEVRLFNPLPVRWGGVASRVAFSMHQFSRINHRMHNKLFVADNVFAISGGRNIADDYFDRAEPANFIDMDLMSSGPVVRELSAIFDSFWNSRYAYPVQSLVAIAPATAQQLFAEEIATASATPLAALSSLLGQESVTAQINAGRVTQRFGNVKVLADLPSKVGDVGEFDGSVMEGHLDLIRAARSEVLVASPYFVPGLRVLAAIKEAVANEVRVSVMTNSLSTTDEPLVHFAYSRYRRALLKMGASLYELMPGAQALQTAREERRGSFGRLHAKIAVVDARWLCIGSMNMDRRSAHSNTEIGLVVDSPELAAEVLGLFQRDRLPRSYKLRIARAGRGIQWVAGTGDQEVVLSSEPQASFGRALQLRMTLALVGEEML